VIGSYSFGGVRTFPLIGLIGYSIATVSGAQLLPLTVGFLVVAAFLLLSYWHKLTCAVPQGMPIAGVTTEMSGLATFLVGALVCYGHFWIATTLAVASLILLDLKTALEKLAASIAPHEILTFAKFLLLSGVILPVLPNQQYGPFHINPFKTWLWWWPSAPSPMAVMCCKSSPRGRAALCWRRCWAARIPPL